MENTETAQKLQPVPLVINDFCVDSEPHNFVSLDVTMYPSPAAGSLSYPQPSRREYVLFCTRCAEKRNL